MEGKGDFGALGGASRDWPHGLRGWWAHTQELMAWSDATSLLSSLCADVCGCGVWVWVFEFGGSCLPMTLRFLSASSVVG